jgi:uncharacterized protein YggE
VPHPRSRTPRAASRALAATTLAFLLSGCAHAGARSGGDELVVVGEGRASASPDVATVSIGIEALAKQLPDALRDADARMRAVVAAVRAAGVPEQDVRTMRYDVALERRFDPQRGGPGELVGYRVVHELRVAVRGGDPARAGVVLDAATRAGANVVHSIAFEKSDPSAEQARALEAALAQARAKAEALARAAGRELGDARTVAERLGGPVVPYGGIRMAKAEAGMPVQAGELEFRAEVEVRYRLR